MPGSAPVRPRQAALSSPSSRLVVLIILEELVLGDLLLGDVGELEDEVDDLVLVDRGPQLRERLRAAGLPDGP